MRDIEEWADRKYAPGEAVAHVVGWGEVHAQCGLEASAMYGTGSFDEIELAAARPLCPTCSDKTTTPAYTEFTAPEPLYTAL